MAAEEDALNDDHDEEMTSERASVAASEGEGHRPNMNTQEMKAKRFYKVKAVLRSMYLHGWRFPAKWEGCCLVEATWEPYTVFILDKGNVNSVFRDYYTANDLQKSTPPAARRPPEEPKAPTAAAGDAIEAEEPMAPEAALSKALRGQEAAWDKAWGQPCREPL